MRNYLRVSPKIIASTTEQEKVAFYTTEVTKFDQYLTKTPPAKADGALVSTSEFTSLLMNELPSLAMETGLQVDHISRHRTGV